MKVFVLVITMALCCSIGTMAQTDKISPETLEEQGQKSLDNGKYIDARYFFKKAYEGFANNGNYRQAIKCGLKANSLFIRENYYKEASELYYSMDAIISQGEQKQNTKFYDLRLLVAKDRLQTYMKRKDTERARDQLYALEAIGNSAKNDSISEEILYTKANYYYTFGPAEQGVNCYRQLISKYQEQGKLEKATECFQNMVALAEKVNNASLAVNTYKQYIAWSDSVKAISDVNELADLKQKHENVQKTLEEKESALSVKQYLIIGLCVLSAILIAALIILAVMLLRSIWLTRKQKKTIEIANEHNQLKSHFIQNISSQMEPALNTLAQTTSELPVKTEQIEQMQTQIEALRSFSNNIQELSGLENTLDQPYELKDTNVNTFCEDVVRNVKPLVKPGVETQVNAYKLQAKICPEQLERVLVHLLKNAAYYTETGKISLEFKKKGAHVHQFIVTDTGPGIPEELRDNIFKPFTEIKDLTQGDGLGLPICSLIAMKMNGNLTLDPTYTRGSRFILELRN